MARIGLYLYIVVLYQNGLFTLLRRIMRPVRERRRGLVGLGAVTLYIEASKRLVH